jgi:hypothetical protein
MEMRKIESREQTLEHSLFFRNMDSLSLRLL